ncbi:MAG: hypothetical protein KatS3mg110_4703 [Pirellulaceae bacterium]|nr:MAG: hypothetical protein KatS3mg110_4703 [Pirellulaceae bacterium]
MTLRVPVKPELLVWAMRRSGRMPEELAGRFKKLGDWLEGRVQPTLKQLEDFARATHTPVGYFFLFEPPEEVFPIPDFRTMPEARHGLTSADLLETIYICQERQAWYREFARLYSEPRVAFVGSATLQDDPEGVAARMRKQFGFDIEARFRMATWTEALRQFIGLAEDAGVLVMVSGIVGSNTHRPLDVSEFRGIALADDLAPLVFINGRDSKAGQMFTLAHELAHLWLGASGVSDSDARVLPNERIERWCNVVAAEFLAPLEAVRENLVRGEPLPTTLERLARHFKVSTLVILRRLFDAGWIDRETLDNAWRKELQRLKRFTPKGNEGNFYNTLGAHVGKRFARAVIVSTLEGQTPFTEAFRLLGVRKSRTLFELAQRLEGPA